MGDIVTETRIEDLFADDDFRALERILSPFNVFTALGRETSEGIHSDMLSFLMRPFESHELSDKFLGELLFRFMRRIRQDGGKPPISPLDAISFDFSDVRVTREVSGGDHGRVDIVVESPKNSLVVIIENKIMASEGVDQLDRYREFADEQYAPDDWDHRVLLYLTPDRTAPRNTGTGFRSVGYDDVIGVLESLADDAPHAARSLLNDYKHILERYVMDDSELRQTCQRLWKRHRRVLQTLMEYQEDTRGWMLQRAKEWVVDEQPDLELLVHQTSEVYFYPKAWDGVAEQLQIGEESGSRYPMLFFTFKVTLKGDETKLYLRFRDADGSEALRKKLWTTFSQHPDFDRYSDYSRSSTWSPIVKKSDTTDVERVLNKENKLRSARELFSRKLGELWNHEEVQNAIELVADIAQDGTADLP